MNVLRNCLIVALLALAAVPAGACEIPVFRYALERWPADAYEVIVFHRGELSPEDRAAAEGLSSVGQGASRVEANLVVQTVELSQLASQPAEGNQVLEETRKLWEEHGKEQLPWLIVRYPVDSGLQGVCWAGTLHDAALKTLADSPVRRELAKRILGKHSAVWLLLESGDAAADNAAAEKLTNYLATMQKELKLPQADVPEDVPREYDPNLPLIFSVLRLSRTDPAEAMFVRTLLQADARLADIKGPLAFPVFGQGRALTVFREEDMTEDRVREVCEFLTGACSCQVKAQNPGVDLLIAANWEDLAGGSMIAELELPAVPELTSAVLAAADSTATQAATTQPATGAATQPAPPAATEPAPGDSDRPSLSPAVRPPPPPDSASDASMRHLVRLVAIIVGLGVVCVIGATIILKRRKEQR